MTKPIAAVIETETFAPEDQESVDFADIAVILEKNAGARGGLIAVLEEIQERYGYLPETALRIVSEKTGASMVDVYSVATFYSSFSLKPRGRHVVCACMGTACHVRGAPRVVDGFERQLGIKAGETTPDKEFTLETVNCLGACALGPVVVVDGRYFSKVKKTGVKQLIDNALTGSSDTDALSDKRLFPIEVSCPRCNQSLMDYQTTMDGHPSIRVTVAIGHRHGRLYLSGLYGTSNTRNEHDIPSGTAVNFLCPHCHGWLSREEECAKCGAPMAAMIIIGGGMLKVCSRIGCKVRMLDL
jgi:NADH-quinone oxidoreductase subunit E